MKKAIIIILTVAGFVVFGTTNAYAQEQKVSQEKVFKTSVQQAPSKVQETLKKYSNYKISKEATYTKKSAGNVYKFKMTKGIFSHFLFINESGKVIAIDSGEQASN